MEQESLTGKKVWILVGTRPDVIKQMPVYLACCEKFGRDKVALIGTGQHRELLDQALDHFELRLNHDLQVMKSGGSLNELSAAILQGMDRLFREGTPDWLVVQGDTTSAAMASWAGFQNHLKVAHSEAGLRSYDLQNPYPEEANRRLISLVADLHFAPTEDAKSVLLAEGIDPDCVLLTGNPGIDALRMTLDMPESELSTEIRERIERDQLKAVLLTAHRRENKGEGMAQWFEALGRFMEQHTDLALIYPIHPNLSASGPAEKFLASNPRVFIKPALSYAETCHLLEYCQFVVTDSGGIQEEAAALGIPTVVCRKATERPEAIRAGLARLAGTLTDQVLEAMEWAYQTPRLKAKERFHSFYGDGYSAHRIAEQLALR